MREIEHEGCGIDGHVEDAGGEGEPGFLESPEGAHRAAHPVVEASIAGHRGGEFAHHQGGGEAPEEREQEQEQEGAAVASFADDVLQTVGAAGDHEICGRNQRQQPHLSDVS